MSIDLLPTIAQLTGSPLPPHKIDGLDVWPLITGVPGARNPHDSYWFYCGGSDLEAVTSGDGKWKLQLPHAYKTLAGRPGGKDGTTVEYSKGQVKTTELYDLEHDMGETTNVSAQHPEIVKQLEAEVEKARAELGDSLTNRKGSGHR